MAQQQAGYFLESIKSLFSKKQTTEQLLPLLHSLSYFELKTNLPLNCAFNIPEVVIIRNMLQRGLPSKLSSYAEDILAATFGQTNKKLSPTGHISYPFINNEMQESLYRALHIIEPRTAVNRPSANQNLAHKNYDDDILFNHITKFAGDFMPQLIQKKVSYKTLVEQTKTANPFFISTARKEILELTADFVINLPYKNNGNKGLIIETEANPQAETSDNITFNKEVEIAEDIAFKLLKFKKNKEDQVMQNLLYFTYNQYFDIIKKNYNQPLFARERNRDALQLALTPFGMARIQKTILDYILAGQLSLKAKKWEIAVIEQDIPAAKLAIEDLKQHFNQLFALTGKGQKCPKIDLSIYYSKEFEQAKLNQSFTGKKALIAKFDATIEYDLLIDISLLSRENTNDKWPVSAAKNIAQIRSSFAPNSTRRFAHTLPSTFLDLSPINKKSKPYKNYTNALHFFAQNIFRIQKLRKNQIQTIAQILTRENTLAISPPAAGKTIAWQLSAFLTPGITAVICPDNRLMREQFDKLQATTDACLYINSDNRKPAIKQRVIANFEDNKALILFVSPEKLINNYFHKIIDTMLANNSLFSLLVFDEAQSISQNSLHFKPQFVKAANQLARLFTKNENENPPVLALTSFAEKSTKYDIWNELDIEPENTIIFRNKTTQFEFNCMPIELETGAKQQNKLEEDLQNSANKKLDIAVELIKKLHTDKSKKIVLVMPQINGIYGVENNPELAQLAGIDYSILGDSINIKAYQKFNIGATRLLITNAQIFSFGFDTKGVSDIIFFNMPASPEQFFRLCRKSGRHKSKANIHILQDKKNLRFIEFSDTEMMTGASEVMELAGHYPPAQIITRKVLRQKFPGRRKELTILDELLHNISFAQETPAEMIERRIFKEFGVAIALVSQPQSNPYMLSATRNSYSIGCVNYKTNRIEIENSNFDKNLAGNILAFIEYETKKMFLNTKPLFIEIFANKNKLENTGIETILADSALYKTISIEITPENNAKKEMIKNLQEFASEDFTEGIVSQAWDNNYYHLSFITDLNQTKRISYVDKNIDLPVRTEQLFYAYRNKEQTFTALNYLKIIGVVDDFYTTGSESKIHIQISKKTNQQYINHLIEYMSWYISTSKAESAAQAIPAYEGKTILQKCLNYLVNFSYEYLADMHFTASDDADKLLQSISATAPSEINKKITDFYANRADAKYLNPLFTPSLVLDTNNLQNSDFEIVINTIRNTGQYISEREHLQASTEVLLKIAPKNYVVLLLNAYTKFWENSDFETGYLRFSEGFDIMAEQEQLNGAELDARKELFLTRLFARSQAVKNEIAPYIKLKSHIAWLQDFNAHFLKGLPA